MTPQGPKTLCSFRGCKNRPTPFPGRMSYKVTKPGSVNHTLACFMLYCCLLGPILCIVVAICSLFLVLLTCQYLPSDWLENN